LTLPMRRVDTIFHLAAMQGMWVPTEEYYNVNVTGTENVCREAMAAGARRIVHVSSWTIYGMAHSRPVTEDTAAAPWHDPYWITKAQGDQLVQRMIAEDHLPAAIIRPGTIFGPGDRLNFGRMADKLCRGRALVIGSGSNALPLVYVTDVVQGLLLCADVDRAQGQVYNITNDEPLSQEDFLRAIAAALGVPPPRLHIPYRAAYAIAFAAERAARFTRSEQPVVTRHGVVLFGRANRHSIDKARTDLGYRPQVNISEGVKNACIWYHRQNHMAPAGAPRPAIISGPGTQMSPLP
jgi:nucleoside-diphosphate-sugar epimerase